jgi:hypothetical protein
MARACLRVLLQFIYGGPGAARLDSDTAAQLLLAARRFTIDGAATSVCCVPHLMVVCLALRVRQACLSLVPRCHVSHIPGCRCTPSQRQAWKRTSQRSFSTT